MSDFRIKQHPILPIPERKDFEFTWQGKTLKALEGETIASALIANGFAFLVITTVTAHPRGYSAPMVNVHNAWSSRMAYLLNPAWS